MSTGLVRLEVNLNEATATALTDVMASRGLSATEVVRRAVSVHHYLDREIAAGRTVQVRDDKRRSLTELVFVD